MAFSRKRDHFLDLGKLRYTHFLKMESKYPIFRFSLILIDKSLNFYMTFAAIRQHMSFLQKSTLFKDKNLLKYTFYIVKKITKILKSHFLKNGFFGCRFFVKNTAGFELAHMRQLCNNYTFTRQLMMRDINLCSV